VILELKASPLARPQLVVDASVSLKWVFDDEEHVAHAIALREDGLSGRFQMIVPHLWQYEVANGVVVGVRRGRVLPDQGALAISSLQALGIPSLTPDFLDCYQLALRYRIALYDASYLALAAELGAEFWTGDRKFFDAVAPDLSLVKWIGSYDLA
jgi:predicted nucleic acid-binding protein